MSAEIRPLVRAAKPERFHNEFAWLPRRTPSGSVCWLVDVWVCSTGRNAGMVFPLYAGRHFSWRTFGRLCAAFAGAVVGSIIGAALALGLLAALVTVALLLDASQAMAATGLATDTVARSPASILAFTLAVLIGGALVILETRAASRASRRGK